MNLPAAKRRAPGTVAPLVDRAQAFSSLLDLATITAAPRVLFGGVKKQRVYSLAPVGVQKSSGLSRRPILLCGAETEIVLEQLLRSSYAGVVAAPGQTVALKGWWQSLIPTYPTDRADRSAEWEALALQKPRKARVRAAASVSRTTPSSTLTTSSSSCARYSPPSAVPAELPSPHAPSPPSASPPTDWTSTPSAVVPPGLDKRPRLGTRLAGLCELHGRCLCAACRSAKWPPLLRLCCRRHHSASDPRMADFCESHRRTPCARCQALSACADVCCGKGHHASPPPQTCPSPLGSGQPATTSPNTVLPASPRAQAPRPARRRHAAPRARQPALSGPLAAAPIPVSTPITVPLPDATDAAAAVAAAAAASAAAAQVEAPASRKRRPVEEAFPPPPHKRRPSGTTAGAPHRRQPTLLQFLGKRERPPGPPEDAAPQVLKRPKPAHGHGRAEPEARVG